MKKLRIAIFSALALALIISASAFSFSSSSKPAVEDQLYWFLPNGTYTGHFRVKSMEISGTCPDTGSTICENGYDDNDLNVPGVPSSGLKSGAVPNANIKRP